VINMRVFWVALVLGLLIGYYFTEVRAPWTLWADEHAYHVGSKAFAANGLDYSELERANGIRDNRCKIHDNTYNGRNAGALCISNSGARLYIMDVNGANPPGHHQDAKRNMRSHRAGTLIEDSFMGPLYGTGGTSGHPR
jgi:hypothetical protein